MTGGKRQKIRRLFSPSATPATQSSLAVGPVNSQSTSPVPSTSRNVPTAARPPANVAGSSSSMKAKNKQERALEVASTFQALLAIVEKTLDGCQAWGPKAAVAAVGEVLRIVKLKNENDDAIKSVQREAQNVLSMTSKQGIDMKSRDALVAIYPDLQSRIDIFRAEIDDYLHELDSYRVAKPLSRPANLSERLKEWLAAGAEVLAADAISKALPEINRKISVSIQNFMLVSQIKNEAMAHATWNQVVDIAGDVKATRQAQDNLALLIAGSKSEDKYQSILAQLYPVETALHNAEGAPRQCHKGTREAVLQQVETWFRDPKSPSVLWLSGIAGTGKTTIAQSICQQLEADLGASFLFSRDFAERRRPSNILPTIAYQLAYSRPNLSPHICEMLLRNPRFTSKTVQVQAQELLFKTLGSDLISDFPVTLLVFDALDECDKENYREGGNVIPLLLHFLQVYPSRFKVVITSRPETSIRRMLESGNGQTNMFVLHEVDRSMVQSDIEAYLCYELTQIATVRGLENAWTADTRNNQAKQLAALADRLFIFAATIIKTLAKSYLPSKTIETFLNNVTYSNQFPYSHLDAMYLQVIKAIVPANMSEQEIQVLVDDFQCIVGAILTLEQPLSFSSLRQLLGVEDSQLHAVIGPLYAVLDVDDALQRPLQVFHLSFPDFLTDHTRCTDVRFYIMRQNSHSTLSICCLRIMNQQLKQNMCGINDTGLLNAEVEDLSERLERCTSAELRYACLHWWAHLESAKEVTEDLVKELTTFTSGRLLQWLELLSIMGRLQSALTGLPKAITWCKDAIPSSSHQGNEESYVTRALNSMSIKYTKLTAWYQRDEKVEEKWPSQELTRAATLLYDANRTTETFFRPISESALHVYESALTFMPRCLLSSQSDKLSSKQVKMTTERRAHWGQDLRVLEGHKSIVCQVVVSPNGSLLASRSDDKTIRLWDISSGVQLLCIDSDSRHLSFLPDSLRLLSLTEKWGALQAWDVVSGELLDTFYLQLDGVRLSDVDTATCGSVSSSGSHVSVGFENGDVCVFAVQDGTTTRLQGHTSSLRAVAFSPDGLRVVSGSDDNTVRLWDVQRQSCTATFHGHKDWIICSVDMSPDGVHLMTLIGSRTDDKSKVWIWNVETQQRLVNMKIATWTYSEVLSASETCFACSSDGSGTLSIYDLTSGRRLALLKGHTNRVSATAFSPDGSYVISGSWDSTLRIWDTQVGTTAASSVKDQNDRVYDMVFSADGTKLVTAVGKERVCWWDTRSGRMTSEIAKSAAKVGLLASGTPVALYWKPDEGKTIDVWNAETGKAITTLRGHSDQIYCAAFSTDSTLLGSGSRDNTVRIWNTGTWECTTTLAGHTGEVNEVRFSPDGSRVVSGSDDKTVRVWDTLTGDALVVLEGHTWYVSSVDFSPDGSRVVSGSWDETVRVWDAATGNSLAVLEGHTDWVNSVRFSSDGLSIVSKGRQQLEWKAGVDFALPTSPSPFSPTFHLDDSGWLFFLASHASRRRLCWLPVDRRGILQSSGHTIALDSTNGVATILLVSYTAS